MNIALNNPTGEELTVEEKKVLDELELFITENFKVYFKVGMALIRIRDSKLYRQTHATFEEYCKDRFDIARRTAYQYISASETVNAIKECAQIAHILPANESQVRPLTRLDGGAQIIAWERAIETAPNGKITSRHVAGIVAEILGERIKNRASGQQQSTRNSSVLPDEIKDIIWNLIEQVREARIKNFSKSLRDDLKQRLKGVMDLLED